jgi:triphosphoribosyl-dephospho-CoA synthase
LICAPLEERVRRVADAVLQACRTEIHALKPGNVSVHAGGHGMCAEDFFRSAEQIAPILANPDLAPGQRILRCVEATLREVGCNTNLGIVLLAAPLAQAALARQEGQPLREATAAVLAALDVHDAELAFAAIRLANPAGLGGSPQHDVHDAAQVNLLQAMRSAAARDRIAAQYATGFVDVFEVGVPAIRGYRARGADWEWSAVGCYLRFLAGFPDTHVLRKHGVQAAESLRKQAEIVETRFKACQNPQESVPLLVQLDAELKRGGINPGTSADLTVASLLVSYLE